MIKSFICHLSFWLVVGIITLYVGLAYGETFRPGIGEVIWIMALCATAFSMYAFRKKS